MTFKKNILFCYITKSSGHQRAAEAIMDALSQLSPRADTHGINCSSYAYPVIGKFVSKIYIKILKHTPQIWDFLYDNPKIEKATRRIRNLLTSFSTKKIYELIKQYRPRCLVCTQAAPMNVLAAIKKKRGRIKIPIVGVVTDFGVHSYWRSSCVDIYLVPNDDVKQKMIQWGIKRSRVLVTGIPTDPRFSVQRDKQAERLRLDLEPDRPTLLVMGGSHGLGPMVKVVSAIRQLPFEIQVIVVCGNNRKLYKEMDAQFSHDPGLKIFAHTKHIPRLMDASDVLVSKPGGLTCSEAMTKGIPMIMLHPIPGQEERNALYLSQHGAAERVETLDELVEMVDDLFSDQNRLEKLREKSQMLAKPFAAFAAAEAILKIINEPVVRPFEETRTVPVFSGNNALKKLKKSEAQASLLPI